MICRNEGIHTSAASGTFLVEDGPYYFCMLEILLGKLSKPLYKQVLSSYLEHHGFVVHMFLIYSSFHGNFISLMIAGLEEDLQVCQH